MATTTDSLKKKIADKLQATHVEVIEDDPGNPCGLKVRCIVVSKLFEGVPLLKRHRMVHDALKEDMPNIHALSQKTLTPTQWEQESNTVSASAPGKVILFGEHSVVYGKRAIATSLSRRTYVQINFNKTGVITLNLSELNITNLNIQLPSDFKSFTQNNAIENSVLNIPVFYENISDNSRSVLNWWSQTLLNLNLSEEAVQSIAVIGYLHSALCGDNISGFTVEVFSELEPGAGTGSSAAFSVALSAAFVKLFGHEFNFDSIEKLAWKAEHIIHGKPSGLDTAISTRGGIIEFKREDDGSLYVGSLPAPDWNLGILLVESGVQRNTKRMVEIAKNTLDILDNGAKTFLLTMDEIAMLAVSALLEEDELNAYPKLETLVRVNQGLLYSLGVSHPRLNKICTIAAKHHLHGKLTGAGGGGNAFILLKPNMTDEMLIPILTELKADNFKTRKDNIFANGVETI